MYSIFTDIPLNHRKKIQSQWWFNFDHIWVLIVAACNFVLIIFIFYLNIIFEIWQLCIVFLEWQDIIADSSQNLPCAKFEVEWRAKKIQF